MDGTLLKPGSAATTKLANLSWQVAGVGDFDADGKSDILWRHAVAGDNVIWLMDGTLLKPASAATTKLANLSWQAQQVSDFDADGKADILWRHAVSGDNVIWLMNGTVLKPESAATTPLPNLDWKVVP
jgi:hypothetical protein